MSASNDSEEPCLHCLINEVINGFVEYRIEEGDEAVDVEKIVDNLVACMCELIATNPDVEARKSYAEMVAKLILEQVEHFRESGCYPGDVTNESLQHGTVH